MSKLPPDWIDYCKKRKKALELRIKDLKLEIQKLEEEIRFYEELIKT